MQKLIISIISLFLVALPAVCFAGIDLPYQAGQLLCYNTAGVEIPCPNLTVTISGNGSVHGTSVNGISYACAAATCPAIPFEVGDQIDLTATGANSTFSIWSGACTGSGNPCSIIMDSDKTLTATFIADPARVRIEGSETPYYAIGTALEVPTADATLLARSSPDFVENIVMSTPVTILLKGGYTDADFSSQAAYTTVSGSFRVRQGILQVSRLKIKP